MVPSNNFCWNSQLEWIIDPFLLLINSLTGWWFQTFSIFHNIWDNPSHWLSCFSRLLKPPTSLILSEQTLISGCWGSNFLSIPCVLRHFRKKCCVPKCKNSSTQNRLLITTFLLLRSSLSGTRPGKRWQKTMERSTHFQWVNPLFRLGHF